MDESKKFICVYFNADSYEHFRVTDNEVKKEIFSELTKTEGSSTNVKELTLAEKTKIQRRAFFVLTIFFVIGFLFSIMIETGSLPDGRYPAIILFLGSFGMLNIILFYFAVVLILGFKYYLVSKVKRIIHSIEF
ncbi:MAG: hypothetical protein MI922_06635 [Bacteroidales bacterium]|nr:hypothetical protein [Bacteroidales bacterium]